MPLIRSVHHALRPVDWAPLLRIVAQFRPARNKLNEDAIGFSAGYLATVSFGFAERLARSTLGTPAMRTLEDILGHAIAHEVGHILLPGNAHTISGIMKAKWNLDDWAEAQRGALFSTPEQAKLMRRELGMTWE